MEYINELKRNSQLWKKILGEKVYCELMRNASKEIVFPNIEEIKIIEPYYQAALLQHDRIIFEQSNNICFKNFYTVFIKTAILYWETGNRGCILEYKESIINSVLKNIYTVPIRVLINEIHNLKGKNLLKGQNKRQEYEYYNNHFLKNACYIDDLCRTYPEMKRLLFLQIYQTVKFLWKIEFLLYKDKIFLVNEFFNGEEFSAITKIYIGLSDSHKKGETVTKIVLDNGKAVIYKPHGLYKEKLFQKNYTKFLRIMGLGKREIKISDFKEYGWEEYIERKECKNINEVDRYFLRMGILLFLCYLMNASDIHSENIIAEGEFPILVDLETFPGVRIRRAPQNVEEKALEEMENSVLSTGILPVLTWGALGEGIVVSALHNERERAPFKSPIICNTDSSDIHIEYVRKELQIGSRLPIYNNKEVNVTKYQNRICEGFRMAYYVMLIKKKNIISEFSRFFETESRIVLRHTQLYSMLLNMSFHQKFLEDPVKRYLFLCVLEKYQDFAGAIEYEKNALLQMNIPIFYSTGKDTNIYDGNDYGYDVLNEKSSYIQWKKYIKKLGLLDLNKQCKLIELSLALLENNEVIINNSQHNKITIQNEIKENTERVLEYIYETAIICEDKKEIIWCGEKFLNDKFWSIASIGKDLYDGLAGMAVCLAIILKRKIVDCRTEFLSMIINSLFQHTETSLKSTKPLKNQFLGAFLGESSVMHGYVLLYEIYGDNIFLEYAQKHSRIVSTLASNSKNLDFISGTAGLIVVLIKLYTYTGKTEYINRAIELGERIWEKAEKQQKGYGIPIYEKKCIAGLAHGSSGYILAYAYLLNATDMKRYYNRIQLLMEFENSLYSEIKENWLDLRSDEPEGSDITAWCNGAAGILLSRMKLREIAWFRQDEIVKEDIEKCLVAIIKNQNMQSTCLCHGLAGNYWILNLYLKKFPNKKIIMERDKLLGQILNRLRNRNSMLAKEKYSVSLMTGITGIILSLNISDDINILS